MRAQLKTLLAFLVCVSACAYAAYRELQWLAIAALVGALCVLYKRQVARVFAAALELLKNTTEAKLGTLEIKTEKRLADIASRLEGPPTWVNAVLSQLSSEEVGLLLTVATQTSHAPSAATKNHLRSLRDRGLIEHEKPTLEESAIVWATPLGKETARVLLAHRAEVPSVPSREVNGESES